MRSRADSRPTDAGDRLRAGLAPGAWLLPGFVAGHDRALLAALQAIVACAPFRHMLTPGGQRMSVAMTSCGALGWITDRRGYRYVPADPESGRAWPAMPPAFLALAGAAAEAAGFPGFVADACLINRYEPGTRLSLHRDEDERDLSAPVVSVSLGLPATFLFGGKRRGDPTVKIPLEHGDVVVWGGPARLNYHGVSPLAEGEHPLLGRRRVNLTFRKAG
jgi:alkylated DNA repair protein (DNA oxidative demethylase)